MSLYIGLIVLASIVNGMNSSQTENENICAHMQRQGTCETSHQLCKQVEGDCVPNSPAPPNTPTPILSPTPPGSREFPADTPMVIVQDDTDPPTPSPVTGPTWWQTNDPTSYVSSAGPTRGPSLSTRRPTTHPSTSRPTTAYPSTSIPTTNMPTTAYPSTIVPTTTSPSTSMPTTTYPTTNMPTTTYPSDSMPTSTSPSTRLPTTTHPSHSMPTTTSPSVSRPSSMPTRGPTGSPTSRPSSTPPPSTTSPTVTNLTRDVFNSSAKTVHPPRQRHPLVVLLLACVGWSALAILMIFGGLYNQRQDQQYAYSHV
jgi:hypothetical protein